MGSAGSGITVAVVFILLILTLFPAIGRMLQTGNDDGITGAVSFLYMLVLRMGSAGSGITCAVVSILSLFSAIGRILLTSKSGTCIIGARESILSILLSSLSIDMGILRFASAAIWITGAESGT
jgi:hypothetical protein